MEVSKLTFSKEFKEKATKQLSPQQKGKLRWERLVEADKNGELQKATRRVEVGTLAGITNYANSYGWVASMIAQGVIHETIRGFDSKHQAIYEYHLGSPLGYTNGRKKLAQMKKEEQKSSVVTKPIIEKPTTENQSNTAIVTIRVGDTELKIEYANIDYVIAILKEIYKQKGE